MDGMKWIMATSGFSHGGESALRCAMMLMKTVDAAVEMVHVAHPPLPEGNWSKLAVQEEFSRLGSVSSHLVAEFPGDMLFVPATAASGAGSA